MRNGRTSAEGEAQANAVEAKMNAPKKPLSDSAKYLATFDECDESGMM